MPDRAPRLAWRSWLLPALCAWVAPALAIAQQIENAHYTDPTDRYTHGVLGDALEWGALELTLSDGRALRMVLPETLVFEDTAPRLHDLDGDGAPEVIVVEASLTQGARLAVYDAKGRIAATPFIGQRNRWLAPVGAGNFYGDGEQVIAYIDRPHLARTLRLWRYKDRNLHPVESLTGLTNHRIGEAYITGGVRNCGQGDEIVTVDADWRNIMVTIATDGGLVARPVAPYTGRASVTAVLNCR